MSNLAPKLTGHGLAMVVAALYGDSVTFTKICIGNGSGISEDGNNLGNPLMTLGITGYEQGTNYVVLNTAYDNSQVDASFMAYEIGVFAKNDAEEEYLYAYHYGEEFVEPIPDKNSNRIVETQLNLIVSIGEVETVNAVLTEAAAYASKEEFKAHAESEENPHKVTAEQVGLGEVENAKLVNIEPDYSEELEKITSVSALTLGDRMSVHLAKIARAVTSLISHTGNNGIHVTEAKKTEWDGKAAKTHQHSTSDITSGTLGIARGGTGGNTEAAARKALGISAIYLLKNFKSSRISFSASGGSQTTSIALTTESGYTPVAIAGYAVTNDGSGSHDGQVDVNNIAIGSGKISVQLINRYSGANHCTMSVNVLYLKNL